jgi:hypothetical protein
MTNKDILALKQLSQEYKNEMLETFKENFSQVVNGREVLREDMTLKDIEIFFQEWLDIPEEEYTAPEEADFTGVTEDR